MKSNFARFGFWRRRERGSGIGNRADSKLRARRVRIELLENRLPLAGDLPLFLFEWDVEGREYEPNVPVPDLWGFRDQGLGTEVSVATGPHAYRSEFLRYGDDQAPTGTRPDGFSSAAVEVFESGRQASVHFSSQHELRYSAMAEKHLVQAVVEHRVTLQIYIREAANTLVNQRVSVASDREVESEGIEVSVDGTTGDLFVGLFPAESERHQAEYDFTQSTYPTPIVHEGVDYFPLTHRISFYTSTSFFQTHTSTSPPGETVSSADVRAVADVVVTVSLDEIEVRPAFAAPRILGLGKPLVLDAKPMTVALPDADSLVYRWYARPLSDEAPRVPIGTGQVLEYAYHEQTVFGELGDYELTLEVEDASGTVRSASKTLTIQMDFLDVVFHGWIPLQTPTSETQEVFTGYADRLQEFAAGRDLPAGSSHQAGSMNWDSHTGFTLALLSRLAAEVASAHPRPDVRIFGTTYFMGLYRWFHHQSKVRAEQAASSAADQIAASLAPALQDPKRSIAVHLIGHSRGGYVASRASEILARRHEVETCFLTVLDGYADDWPGFAASFADGSIQRTATARNGVNLLVEQDLTELAVDTFVTWVKSTIGSAAATYLPTEASQAFATVPAAEIEAAIRRRVQAWDWRAPQRAGVFDTNSVVAGTPETGPSNHVNIHEIYFGVSQAGDQSAADGTSGLLDLGPLGDPLSCVPPGGEIPSDPLLAAERLRKSASVSAADLAGFASIRDFVREHGTIFEGHEPWLNTFVDLLATDGYLESVLFGNDRVALESDADGEPGLKLSAEEPLEVFLENPLASHLELTLWAETLGQSSDVALYLDGELFDTLAIERVGEQTWSLPLPAEIDPYGPLVLGLSLGDGVADLRLKSVMLVGPHGYADFEVEPAVAMRDQADSFRFVVEPSATTPVAEVERVEFFTTSSRDIDAPVGGNPSGSEHVRRLGAGVREGDRWSLSVPAEIFDVGVSDVYASFSLVGGGSLRQAVDLEVVTTRSRLTNHSLPSDVNRDGRVTALDALLVVNLLARGSHDSFDTARASVLPDTNGDGSVTALDALLIINTIARRSNTAEGEAAASVIVREPVAKALTAQPMSHRGRLDEQRDGLDLNDRETFIAPRPWARWQRGHQSRDRIFAAAGAFLADSWETDSGADAAEVDRRWHSVEPTTFTTGCSQSGSWPRN